MPCWHIVPQPTEPLRCNRRFHYLSTFVLFERSQMTSKCCTSRRMLYLNTLFILNLFIFQGFILQCLKQDRTLQKKKINLYIFNLSAKKLQTSSLVIYLNLPQALLNNFSEKENWLKKKNQYWEVLPYHFSWLSLFTNTLFLLQASTRFDGLKCPFTQCREQDKQ